MGLEIHKNLIETFWKLQQALLVSIRIKIFNKCTIYWMSILSGNFKILSIIKKIIYLRPRLSLGYL